MRRRQEARQAAATGRASAPAAHVRSRHIGPRRADAPPPRPCPTRRRRGHGGCFTSRRACQTTTVSKRSSGQAASRRDRARRRGPHHPRTALEVGPDRQEVGAADRLQRRRHDREGARAQGSSKRTSASGRSARPPSAPATRSATARAPRRLLAHAIYAEGVRNVEAGASAVDIKRGLDRGLRAAVARDPADLATGHRAAARRSRSRRSPRTTTSRSASSSPTRSSGSGADGVVSLEDAKGTETALEVVEGMSFDRGFLSPYFVTDPARMECVLDKPLILIHEAKIAVDAGARPAARARRAERPPAADHRRGHRDRGARDADRQQGTRHAVVGGGQGAGVRRSTQGDARRHRHADRRRA